MKPAAWKCWSSACVIALMLAGCAGRGGPKTATGTTGAAPPSSGVLVDEPLPWPTILLDRIAVVETTDEATLSVSAPEPLVWTSYRDAEDDFVLELVGARPADGVETPALQAGGLIASVDVTVAPMLARNRSQREAKEMTRMVVRTSQPTVHALRTEGTTLRLTFSPSRPRAVTVAKAKPPSATSAPPASAPPPPPARPAPPTAIESEDLGEAESLVPLYETLDEPESDSRIVESRALPDRADRPDTGTAPRTAIRSSPPPAGTPRGESLIAVETRAHTDSVEIRLIGDGVLQTDPPFELAGPPRLVLDLPGVTAEVRERTHYVGHPLVDRVRIGQFQVAPDVARVVLDLGAEPVEVHFEPADDGVTLVVERR